MSLQAQHQEHKERTERLYNRPYIAYDKNVLAIEKKLTEVSKALMEKSQEVKDLRIALADAHARILSQAELIVSYQYPEEEIEGKRPIRMIIKEVLEDYPGVSVDDILGVRRSRYLIEPRHKAMVAVYTERQDLSPTAIGNAFKRDRTTILHAVEKVHGNAGNK